MSSTQVEARPALVSSAPQITQEYWESFTVVDRTRDLEQTAVSGSVRVSNLGSVTVANRSFAIGGGALMRPVRAHVSSLQQDEAVVVEPHTGIHGSGPTLADAVLDFRAALVDHYDALNDSGPLSTELKQQLIFLARHLLPPTHRPA